MGPSGLSERALVALRTSKLSKNCASRGLVGPFRRAARAEKGPPGLQGGGGGGGCPRRLPPLATCLHESIMLPNAVPVKITTYYAASFVKKLRRTPTHCGCFKRPAARAVRPSAPSARSVRTGRGQGQSSRRHQHRIHEQKKSKVYSG